MRLKAAKLLCLSIFVLLLGVPALAQNTKGDRPEPSPREARFKTPKKSKQPRIRRGGDRPGRTVSPRPSRARRGERPGKPVTPQFSKSRAGKSERAWKGDISGRRIQPRSSTSRAKNVYPQPANINYSSKSLKRTLRANDNPNVRRVRKMQREDSEKPRVGKPIRPTFHKTRPQHSERAWRGDITGRRIRAGTSDRLRPRPGEARTGAMSTRPRTRARGFGIIPRISGRARNIFSGKSFYVNNQSQKPPRFQSERSRMALSMLKRYNRRSKPSQQTGKVVPRSASSAYMARRSTNIWARFPRPKGRGERAYTRDLAGKRLRTKNFETQRPILINPTMNYKRRTAAGERPYKGPAAGSHLSRTRSGRAWLGDIAHRAIRGGFRSKKGEPRAGSPISGRRATPDDRRQGKYQGNIRTGRRALQDQGEEYSGNIRLRKPLKGGGSVSGSWNNKGQPIQGRTPGKGADRIGYSGNMRAGRRAFNDQGEEYTGNIKAGRRVFNDQGEEYTGNIKFRKPDKGGGSRSGKHWNNNNTPILVRTPKGKSAQIAGYQGNIKSSRRAFQDQGEEYTGNIKSRRPDKGGGSVSGTLWNNNEKPIAGRTYAGQTKISRYAGNLRARRPEKGGGSVSGRLWNNNERPIDGKAYVAQTKISRYSGTVKAKRPEKGGGSVSGQLWNNDEKPVEGKTYTGLTRISRYSGNLKAKKSDKSTASLDAGRHNAGARRDLNYIKNPSAADEAQKTREPGRAFGRSADFQGNIRIRKFDLFRKSDLHPDAQFVKNNKNNVAEERDMLTNFKLWWARLFRKAETQPDHLKENDKDRKPRYDKGEAGLWYE